MRLLLEESDGGRCFCGGPVVRNSARRSLAGSAHVFRWAHSPAARLARLCVYTCILVRCCGGLVGPWQGREEPILVATIACRTFAEQRSLCPRLFLPRHAQASAQARVCLCVCVFFCYFAGRCAFPFYYLNRLCSPSGVDLVRPRTWKNVWC